MAVLGQNNLIKVQTYGTGTGTPSAGVTGDGGSASGTWYNLDTDQTNHTGTRTTGNTLVMEFEKISNTSDLKIVGNIPGYINVGGSGIGFRLAISINGFTTTYVDALDQGPMHGWGAMGYGGSTSGIVRMIWNTELIDAVRSSGIYSHTGTVGFYIQYRVWVAGDTYYPLHYYDANYPKYGTFQCYEIER
jgi:hypothetical protein